MRFSLSIPTDGLPTEPGLGDVKVFPVNASCLDLDAVHGSDDPSGFVRLSKAHVTKPAEEEGGEDIQVVVTTVHSADWKAESWKRLCSGEFEFYDAFVIEGLEAVAAAEGEAGAEGDAVDHTREDITEVAAGYTGEAVHSTKLTRRLWAFVLAEEGAEADFKTLRELDLMSENPEWSEPKAVSSEEAPAARQGHSICALKDSSNRAWMFGGADASQHTMEDGAADSLWGFYNDAWELDLGTLAWTKISTFTEDSVKFGVEHGSKLGDKPLSEVEGIERLAELPTSGPEPRSRHAAVTGLDGKMWVLGGSFFTRAAADAEDLVGAQVFSANQVWSLEEKDILPPEPGEGEDPAEPTKGYCWTMVDVGGVSREVINPSLNWSAADHANGTFPWSQSNALVMSGGMSNSGLSYCELLYCELGDGGMEWKELREKLWQEPPALTEHAVRLEQPRAADGEKQAATLITTGGYCWSPGDGWLGSGSWRSSDASNGTWSMAEDNTVTCSHLDPVYNIFRSAQAPSAEQLISQPHNLQQRDEKHLCTWLHWAAHSGSANIASYLLNKCSADPFLRDRYGQTALHVACATGARSTAVALMLIEACTDNSKLEMKDFYGGKTPLHAAARGGNAAVTKALCDRGVDINATADDGGTALHVACAWGCHEVVKQLLEAGADRFILNKENHSALQEVCRGTKTTTESKNMIQDAFKNVYVV